MSYQLLVSAYRAHLVNKIVFLVYLAFLSLSCENNICRALLDIEGILADKSVNQAHLINKGKLDRVHANQFHSITKGFLQVHSVNQASIG